MTELDTLDRTLDLACAELSPSFADDARARRALGLPNAVPEGAGGAAGAGAIGTGATGMGAWAALRTSGTTGALLGALLVGMGFGGGYWLGRGETTGASRVSTSAVGAQAAKPHTSRMAAPSAGELPPDEAPTEPAATEESLARADHTPTERSSPRRTRARGRGKAPDASRSVSAGTRPEGNASGDTTPDPAGELALLRRVEKSLRAGDAAYALALLGELDESFAKTQLGEEREAARVMAHCALGDAGARQRAERFLRQHAGSVYAERVREACSVSAE